MHASVPANIPTVRHLFRQFWRLSKPFWTSEEKWKAYGLLAVVVGLNLGSVYMNVLFNSWYNTFYNTLQNFDSGGFKAALIKFGYLAFVWIVISVYRFYLQQMLEIKWRRWYAKHLSQRWLEKQGYYRLQLTDRYTDNPDQRIAEDTQLFVGSTLGLALGLMNSLVTFFSFVTILWTLSGPLHFTLWGHEFNVQGYMVWVALIYALVGSVVTVLVGRPLVKLNFEQQRREADFRFGLVRVRENAESVALYHGEAREGHNLGVRIDAFVANFWAVIRRQKRIIWFTSFWGQLAIIFPLIVAAPRYFAKEIQLGGLMQINSAFGQVYGALDFVIGSFSSLASWKAIIDRLITFEDGLILADALPVPRPTALSEGLRIDGLNVKKPDGTPLFTDLNLELKAGDRLLVQGPSGSGKSTLLRTLAGIWPYSVGEMAYVKERGVLFLAQKPYLPLGTLREILCYPAPPSNDDAELDALLAAVRLDHLVGRLNDVDNWSHILSLGEQQRIAFARALFIRPAVLMMDEASSALDEPNEAILYQLIEDRLADSIIVSVGHRSTLRIFHNHYLETLGDGSWRLA
ncbi:ATP-binding protein [Jeongeupia sp. HS-3]|uniref:ABC transporter ATP-binding protein/permease n=1 Tax=Jeongeupia sp. HS-3 TaxID=1009682 RepID=UPI0018A3C785|nr:ABC transporter ATP-binding protein/permease [Jeongeupia sp. HS-3]BCL75723.1 ATP-binding protein [Jeongeupia sp. HS-3]